MKWYRQMIATVCWNLQFYTLGNICLEAVSGVLREKLFKGLKKRLCLKNLILKFDLKFLSIFLILRNTGETQSLRKNLIVTLRNYICYQQIRKNKSKYLTVTFKLLRVFLSTYCFIFCYQNGTLMALQHN